MSPRRRAIFGFALILFSAVAGGQSAQLEMERGSHYPGVAVALNVVVDGFAESPQPEVEFAPIANAKIELTGISPQTSTRVQIVNGRMTQTKNVRFTFHYRFQANAPGDYLVGPFTVSQNSERVTTRTAKLTVTALEESDDYYVKIAMAEGPFVVGQRLPVAIEWWIDPDQASRLGEHRISTPIAQETKRFRLQPIEVDARNALIIDTPQGTERRHATLTERMENGRKWLVLSAPHTLELIEPGTHELEGPSLVVKEVTRWRRDLFGDRIPAGYELARKTGEPTTLVVKPVPTEGRPASYGGAVGRGFSLSVEANRSVILVGDPITLNLTLQGNGRLETLSLPSLEGLGLSPQSFRLPDGPVSGRVDADKKQFEIVVRVLRDDVTEIPPLAFSWFDPELGQFQTTRSEPIALSVNRAAVVSADDVVRSEKNPPENPTAHTTPTTTPPTTSRESLSGAPAFSLSGAELSIEPSVTQLSTPPHAWYGGWPAQLAMYWGGLLTLMVAWFVRRKAGADPTIKNVQNQLKRFRGELEKARRTGDVANILRQMASVTGPFPRERYDAFLAECDNRVFAPGGRESEMEPALRERALAVANELLASAGR